MTIIYGVFSISPQSLTRNLYPGTSRENQLDDYLFLNLTSKHKKETKETLVLVSKQKIERKKLSFSKNEISIQKERSCMMLIRIKKLTVFSLTNTSPAVSNKADSQEILQKFS